MHYDAIIVGARVAGATLAMLLGRQGRRVLLVDRATFPSDTLSTHFLNPFGVARLAELGVLQDVEALGFRRVPRVRSIVADCIVDVPFTGPGPFTYALVSRRDGLDAILIKHARRNPTVEFREGTAVERLLWEDDCVVGAALRCGERREEARAAVVVGADGRHSAVAQWVAALTYEETPALRPAYFGYYRGVTPLPEPAIEVFFQEGYIGFLFPMQPDVDCLGLEVHGEDFATFRQDPHGCLEERFRQLYGMADRMAGARLEGLVYGTRGIANFLRRSAGPGWALAGDAACCKDPITGTGIRDAFSQSVLLAEALGKTFDGADWDATLDTYQCERDDLLLPFLRETVDIARQDEISAEALAWFHAALCKPFWVHTLASNIQAAVAAPGVIPPFTLGLVGNLARLYGATPPARQPPEVAR